MPTLQAFDGDTLEAALARVAEEHGPGARIRQAEKVRSGGLAGFFARERYEVTVEVDDDPRGVDEPEVEALAGDEATPEPAPRSLLDLAERVSAIERGAEAAPWSGGAGAATVPAPSTEGPTFREVLRDIAAQAGLLDGPSGPVPPEAAPPVPAEPAETQRVEAERVEAEPAETERVEAERVEQARPGPAPLARRAEPDPFASLGIPGWLLQRPPTSASVAQRLLAVLEGVEPAPPVLARRGDVVAVVGCDGGVLDAARLLAEELGQTAEDVVVAGPDETGFHTVCDAESAASRRALWRRCGVPFVVAVQAPAGPRGAAWASEVLEALDPVTVWAAVAAERKPEDVVAWVERVGGADALAVSGCDATASPAAVLGTGIPVAVVEGRRASPAAWTALLVERLTV